MKSRFSRRSEELKARRSRRRRTEAGMSPEQLEERQMMAVVGYDDISLDTHQYGRWVTLTAEDGDNLFVKQVVRSDANGASRMDWWAADNSSFENKQVIGLVGAPNTADDDPPYNSKVKTLQILQGSQRSDLNLHAVGYPMWQPGTTRFTLPLDGLDADEELTGSVSIMQPDDTTSTWVFTNREEDGGAGGPPRLVSGVGVSQAIVPGYFYPLGISAGGGPSATSKSVIDIQWNVERLAQVPELSVNVWSTSAPFAVDQGPFFTVLRPSTGSLRPSAPAQTFISLADAAGAGLNPIAASSFQGRLTVDGVEFDVTTGGPNALGEDRTRLFFRRVYESDAVEPDAVWTRTGNWESDDATYTVNGRLQTGVGGARGVELSMSGDFTVSLNATYVTMTNGSPVSATLFAGQDIQAALDVKLPGSGSTFNVDSKVRVESGGLEVSATNVSFNAQVQAFDSTAVASAAGGIKILPIESTAYGSVSRETGQAFAVAEIRNGGVERITIPPGLGGAGYDAARPPVVTIARPENVRARAVLRTIVNGQVDSIAVTNGGSGYTTTPLIRISAPAAGGRQAQAVAIIQGGVVTAVQVTDRGLGYNRPPIISFEGGGAAGGGAGAAIVSAQATADVVGGLGSVVVLDGGSGYAPNSVVPVRINNLGGRTGTGASARALTNSSGAVDVIELQAAGSGYSLESTELLVDPPPPNLNPDIATARAVVDPRTSRISEVIVTHRGSGYGVSPTVSIAGPPTAIGTVRSLSTPEVVTFNALVAAHSFDIELRDDPGTADVVRSRLLVSPSSKLARTLGGEKAADSIFVDSHDGDVFVAGQINALTQSYRLVSSQDVQDKLPYIFSTAGHADGLQTGQIIGDSVAVTLANDLDTPSRGAFAQNEVALRTNVDSLRIRAARRSGQPIDEPFPYRLSIDEVEDIRFDAVAASSFPVVIKGNGAVQLASSLQTVGGIDITARGDFSTTAPLATARGSIAVTARSMAVTNTIDVTAAARDLTGGSTDIQFTATGGNLVLEGDVSAVNDIRLVQQNPDELRITEFAAGAGGVLATTATRHGLVEGDFVSIAGTVNYDGFRKVVSVSSDTTFEFETDRVFVPESGKGLASRAVSVKIAGFAQSAGNTLVKTTIPHGLQVGSRVVLRDSETYSDSYTILVVRSSTEFEIPRLFVPNTADETGTVLITEKGSLVGAGRLSGIRLAAEAAGSIDVKTKMRSIDLRSQRNVAIDELDDVRITSLVAGGRAAVLAAGADPLASGYNPIALTVDQVTGVSQLEVSAPNGSLDVTVNASTPLAMGGAEFKAVANMQSAGNVRIRSRASSLNVYDAPVAGGSARIVRAATTAPLLASYLPGVESIKAGELRGNGNINATGLFDGVSNLAVGDRVLVRLGSSNAGATTDESNGVYVVSQVGGGAGTASQWRLTRALDSATAALMPSNSVVRVGEGTTFANTAHRVRYASIPSDAVVFVATDKFQLPLDYPAFELLQIGQLVQGEAFSGTVASVDSSTGLVTLESAVIGNTVVGASGTVTFPSAALGFGEIFVEEIELSTNIGTDPLSTATFIVSTTAGTNGDAGSLGKMLLLRQFNDTTAELLNPVQRMAFGFGNLSGPIELKQELPLITAPIAIDGSARYPLPAASGTAFAPIVVDGSRIVTTREGSPVRVVGMGLTSEPISGFEFNSGSEATGSTPAASIANLTVSGFARGNAVKVDGVSGILLNSMTIGRDKVGGLLSNQTGIHVTGPGASAIVVSSTIVASTLVGILVDRDAAGVTIVGTAIGSPGQGNAYGLDIKAGFNQVGVVPVPSGRHRVQTFFNGTTLAIPETISRVVPLPLYVGQSIAGGGIAPGTVIAAINGGSITLSRPMTATRATTLVFGRPGRNSIGSNVFGALISGGSTVVRNSDFGSNTYDGISVTGGTNFIGTSPRRDGLSNAFFGNGRWGVHLSAAANATTRILGNFFGSVARATAGLANGSGSVAVDGQPHPEHAPAFTGNRRVAVDRHGNQHIKPIARGGFGGSKSTATTPSKTPWR